jgi:hypothetical protein
VLRIHAGGTFWCSQEGALRMRDQGNRRCDREHGPAAQMGNFGQTNQRGEGRDRLDDLHNNELRTGSA